MLAYNIKGSIKPYVFLHGFMGSSHDWDNIRSFFPGSIAIDLPGHGSSSLTYTQDLFLDIIKQIKQLLDELSLNKIHLVGYSLGGRIAMMFANRYPKTISCLNVISAHPGYESKEDKDNRKQNDLIWVNLLKTLPFETFLQKWYQQSIFLSLQTKQKLFKDMLEVRKTHNPRDYPYVLNALSLSRQPFLLDDLAKQTFSTHFIYGEHDKTYSFLYEKLKMRYPNISFIGIANAGHAIPTEEPLTLAKLIKDTIL